MAGQHPSWAPDAPGDFLPPELENLLRTARLLIGQHVSQQGTCADCGSRWPCQSAELAAFTLGAL